MAATTVCSASALEWIPRRSRRVYENGHEQPRTRSSTHNALCRDYRYWLTRHSVGPVAYPRGGSMGGGTCPQPQSAWVMGIAEIRGKKLEVGGWVPDHLGETNYAEICILVTKYISKLDKIQNTITCQWCHVFNCVFQILVFQFLDNSANKHVEQPRFLSFFTSGSCSLAK